MELNPYFTMSYDQPEEYRFSLDSVFLARKVFELYQMTDLNGFKIADLCAGCGIVGFDFLIHVLNQNNTHLGLDFIEIQGIYRKYFDLNLARFSKHYPDFDYQNRIKFLEMNYKDKPSNCENKYDLIFSNPPYFFKENGKLSNSDFKNRCRFFLDASYEQFLEALFYML